MKSGWQSHLVTGRGKLFSRTAAHGKQGEMAGGEKQRWFKSGHVEPCMLLLEESGLIFLVSSESLKVCEQIFSMKVML